MKNFGVLALQGAVSEHLKIIQGAGHNGISVKTKDQISDLDGLIIPGGESTAIGKLMEHYGFVDTIRTFANSGKPILGTCAGMVLLSGGKSEGRLNLIDMEVVRNGFGRQRESFEANINIKGMEISFPAVFIRAPYVKSTSAEILATVDDKIVFVKQKNLLACSFHPELTNDNRIFESFFNL